MNKRLLVDILIVLVLAVAVMIFLFSAQDAKESSKTSKSVAMVFVRLFRPDFAQLSSDERWTILHYYDGVVRKAAHCFEFFLLGTFLFLALHGLKVRACRLIAWIGGTLYACSDEFHQMLVDGRGPQIVDVVIDSIGVVLGILLGMRLLALFHRIWPKQEKQET